MNKRVNKGLEHGLS